MTVKFTNNANSTLASGINSSVTSMTVADASSFPSLSGANDYCYLTLQESGGTTREIVKATARSSNTFTVVRGQDNTSAATWSSGVLVELRITSALLQDVIDGLGSGSMMDTDIFAGDGSDTTFTLSRQPDNENNLLIFIDGVFQAHNAYSVSGTTLTLSAAPANGRVITAYHMATTVGGSNLIKATMTGDNSDTTLDVGSQIIHENNVQVYFDGVYQSKGNYSVSGSVITFSTAPPTGVAVEAILNTATNISTAAQLADADSDTLIQVEESADEDTIRMDIAGTEVLTLTNSAMTLKGTTPTLTIGDAGAEDTKIVFDGNAQDYYIGLDDSVDKLLIGLGSTVGTTPAISIDENLNTKIEAGNFLLETSGKYVQTAGSSSNFWALGSTGGTGSPGTGSTSFGIHNYNGSAWSNPVVITNAGKVGIGVTPDALLHVKHAGGGFDEVARLTAVANSAGDGAFLGFHGNSTSKFYGFIGGYDIGTNEGGVKIGVGNGETAIADSMTAVTIDNDSGVHIGGKFAVGNAPIAGTQVWIKKAGSSDNLMRWGEGDGTTQSSYRFRIDQNFDFIGNSGSAETFSIASSTGQTIIGRNSASFGATTGIVFRPNNDSYVIVDEAPCLTLRRNNTNGDIMQFYRDGTQCGYISVTASATSYQSGSDYRLKENVTYDWEALPRLAQLKPARFNFKVDPDSTVDGFLAHEAQAVVPNAVGGTYNETKDLSNVVLNAEGNVLEEGVTEDDWKAGKEGEEPEYAADTTWKAEHTKDVYQGIDQSKLVPLMVKAIQEQQALIETLEAKVKALEEA